MSWAGWGGAATADERALDVEQASRLKQIDAARMNLSALIIIKCVLRSGMV